MADELECGDIDPAKHYEGILATRDVLIRQAVVQITEGNMDYIDETDDLAPARGILISLAICAGFYGLGALAWWLG